MHIGGVVAVVLSAGLLTGCTARQAPTPAPTASATRAAFITVGDERLPWAGTAPFDGAVVDSPQARQVSVQIRQLPTDGPFSACADPHFVPSVRERGELLVVDIATYAPEPRKEPHSLGCVDGLGGSAIPLVVALPSGVGDRALVDAATGRRVPVLDASSMPSPDPEVLPDAVEPQPLQWDDRRRVAWRRWVTDSTRAGDYQDVWLLRGPAAGIAAGAPTPGEPRTVEDLGEGSARLWIGRTSPRVVVVRWTRGADSYEVRTVRDGDPAGQVDEALAIARSVDEDVVARG